MVKTLYFLFSFYILFLAAAPCCSESECLTSQIQKKEIPGKSSSKDQGCEGCSPFVTCASCPGFIVNTFLTGEPVLVNTIAQSAYNPYVQPVNIEITIAFWQPPKSS